MGRSYRTTPPQLIDYAYKAPVDLMMAAVKNVDTQNDALQNQLDLFGDSLAKIKYLDPDKARIAQKQLEYQGKVDELTNSINQNPQDWRRYQGDIKSLGRKLATDYTSGEFASIQDNYNKYQAWDKEENERFKRGDITADFYRAAKAKVISDFKGTNYDVDLGTGNKINPIPIAKYVDVGKSFDEYLKDVVANSERISGTTFNGMYRIKTEGGVETVSFKRLKEIAEARFMSDVATRSYLRQGDELGLFNSIDVAQNAMSAAVNKYGYTKSDFKQDIDANPVAMQGASQAHAEKMANINFINDLKRDMFKAGLPIVVNGQVVAGLPQDSDGTGTSRGSGKGGSTKNPHAASDAAKMDVIQNAIENGILNPLHVDRAMRALGVGTGTNPLVGPNGELDSRYQLPGGSINWPAVNKAISDGTIPQVSSVPITGMGSGVGTGNTIAIQPSAVVDSSGHLNPQIDSSLRSTSIVAPLATQANPQLKVDSSGQVNYNPYGAGKAQTSWTSLATDFNTTKAWLNEISARKAQAIKSGDKDVLANLEESEYRLQTKMDNLRTAYQKSYTDGWKGLTPEEQSYYTKMSPEIEKERLRLKSFEDQLINGDKTPLPNAPGFTRDGARYVYGTGDTRRELSVARDKIKRFDNIKAKLNKGADQSYREWQAGNRVSPHTVPVSPEQSQFILNSIEQNPRQFKFYSARTGEEGKDIKIDGGTTLSLFGDNNEKGLQEYLDKNNKLLSDVMQIKGFSGPTPVAGSSAVVTFNLPGIDPNQKFMMSLPRKVENSLAGRLINSSDTATRALGYNVINGMRNNFINEASRAINQDLPAGEYGLPYTFNVDNYLGEGQNAILKFRITPVGTGRGNKFKVEVDQGGNYIPVPNIDENRPQNGVFDNLTEVVQSLYGPAPGNK